MTPPAHLRAIGQALEAIADVMATITISLPEPILKQHFISTKTAPLSWEAVYWRHLGHCPALDTLTPEQLTEHDRIADLLSDLKELAICKEKLQSMILRRRGHVEPEALALPKVRRSQ